MAKLLPAKELGRKLVELREARGWKTASAFARHIGKDPSELSRWENGRVQPEYDTVVNLALALDVDISDFLENGAESSAGPPPTDDEAREGKGAPPRQRGSDDLARQIDDVLGSPGEWIEKSYFMESIAASYRARAMDRAEERALLREQRQAARPEIPGTIPPKLPEKGGEEAA